MLEVCIDFTSVSNLVLLALGVAAMSRKNYEIDVINKSLPTNALTWLKENRNQGPLNQSTGTGQTFFHMVLHAVQFPFNM